MKRFVLSLILSVSLLGSAFCENIFAHRFFEIKVDVPVSVSNNLVGLSDIFQKTVVIDLPKIADSLKLEKGANLRAETTPSLSINLDIPKGLILGVSIGAEADVSLGISDDIFQFLGHGNAGMGNNLKQGINNTYVDIFANVGITGGWNGKKNRIAVTGTLFAPVAHIDAGDTYIQIFNNEETNEFGAKAVVDAKMYAAADYKNGMDQFQKVLSDASKGMGFDLSADVQRDLFRFLTVGAKARIPLVPGRLSMLSSINQEMEYEMNIDDLMNGEENKDGSGQTNSSENEEEKEFELGDFVKLDKPYEIHRPLKLGVSADFHPFGTLLTTSGYLGIGVRHPFAKDTSETNFYFDYSIGGKLSLWNVLNFELSHSYIDQLFRNEFAVAVNIRLVEVDAGISLQSASFAKSFTGAGLGAFVTVSIGF